MYYICNFYFCKLFLYLFCFLPVIAVNRIFIFTFLCFVDKQRRLSSQQYFFLPFDDFFFFFFFFCCRCFFFLLFNFIKSASLKHKSCAPNLSIYVCCLQKTTFFAILKYKNICQILCSILKCAKYVTIFVCLMSLIFGSIRIYIYLVYIVVCYKDCNNNNGSKIYDNNYYLSSQWPDHMANIQKWHVRS